MTYGTIHCPGCGRRATVADVVCRRCREFLPQSLRDELDRADKHPALLPGVLHAVLVAVSDPGPFVPARPGMRPLLGGR